MTKTPHTSGKKRDDATSTSAPASAAAVEVDDPERINLATIKSLAEIVTAHELGEIELRRGDHRVRITRGGGGHTVTTLAPWPAPQAMHAPMAAHAPAASGAAPASAAPAAEAAPAKADTGKDVLSPFVGTFYRAPSPEAPTFCEVGQRVKKGQVLCIVEAMKLMNEIEAELEGTVTAVLAENGQPVEFGQPLFRIA
ncbi:MAG: acetyl-CoA carboxylase biotin carboxyl carrier protein [Deltaproteobacteria bacterium]|nr:acetyl-CoA carboxylase biotin carboxyl carrier protein [Deltaproteobacteria bacterium]